MIAVLVWFYFFGAILLYGAEFTRHYIEQYGVAVRVDVSRTATRHRGSR